VARSLPSLTAEGLHQRREGDMIRGLLDSGTVRGLRQELDASMVRTREIAHRVGNASNGTSASFESALDDAMQTDEIDLEHEMVQLAGEQIRYEAMGQILQKMYGQIRSSMRSA